MFLTIDNKINHICSKLIEKQTVTAMNGHWRARGGKLCDAAVKLKLGRI